MITGVSVKSIPILHLPEGTSVVSMFPDNVTSSVLISLSDGRILTCDSVSMLGSLTGLRTIYSEVVDGFGFTIPSPSLDVMYALHNRILEINSSKSSLVWKKVEAPLSATIRDEIKGVFTSQVMWGGNDFGFWDNIYWEEDTPTGCSSIIYLRTAESEAEISSAEWVSVKSQSSARIINQDRASSSSSETSESSEDRSRFRRNMDEFNLKGNYIQLRAELSTTIKDISPTIYKATISYRTKHAVYFFTQKFNMEAGTSSDGVIITGNYTAPQNTEVQFGMTGTNSIDWNDYSILDPDSIMAMPSGVDDKFKIGVKFTSSDPAAYATVDEFAVMLGGEEQTELNS